MPHQLTTIDCPEEDYLYTQTSQLPNAGLGLFTAITIHKHEIISVFKGEILSDEEAEKREKESKNGYFVKLLSGKIMDSANTPCFAKYANDSHNSDFKSNAEIRLDDSNRVCLVATKNIKKNAEIFCSYGLAYWKTKG